MKTCSLNISALLVAAAVFLHPHAACAAIPKCGVLENNVGYVRIARADKGLLDDLQPALNHLDGTNGVAGIVVDLRFANGTDSDLEPVENLLEQTKLPLAILINGQTAGAAARLAEDLREENTGLVFGAATENFQPDIPVPESTNNERFFLKNPYGVPARDCAGVDSSTNLLAFVDIDHTTEADLVREKIKDGDQDGGSEPDIPAAPQKPFIHDPVLARAVDFIKGISALRLSKVQE